jgi:hypothetical protein
VENPVRLRRLNLGGVQVADKGAAALAAAVQGNRHLRALLLPRCGVRDAGGAALCRALAGGGALRELDLSWNASGRATALALDEVLRGTAAPLPDTIPGERSSSGSSSSSSNDEDAGICLPRLALRTLRLRNNGLSDRDGALLIDALAARSTWRLVDLSENLLEGGAALCARQVVVAMAAADANDADGIACSSSSSGSEEDKGDEQPHSDARAWLQDGVVARRALVLDANPLGASGALCLMRALAGCHAVADTAAGAGAGAAAASSSSAADAKLPLHVSIHGCSLLAGDKGFRLGMSDGTPAVLVAPQVATLFNAVQQAPAAAPAAATKPAAGRPDGGGKTKQDSGKGGGGKKKGGSVAPVAPVPTVATLVVTEKAAGLNLNSPSGSYGLDLSHPSSQHIIQELLGLKARLLAFQQQQEAAAAEAAAAAAATAAPRRCSTMHAATAGGTTDVTALGGWPARRRSTRDYVNALVRLAPLLEAAEAASRRVSQGEVADGGLASSLSPAEAAAPRGQPPVAAAAIANATAAASAGKRAGSGAGGRGLVQRFRAPPVDAISFADIRLDGGRPIKLEKLLELWPWVAARRGHHQQQQQQQVKQVAETANKQPAVVKPAPTAVKQQQQTGGGAGVSGSSAKPKGPRSYKRVAFAVKAAAVVSAEEPRVVPERLLRWAVKVRDLSC